LGSQLGSRGPTCHAVDDRVGTCGLQRAAQLVGGAVPGGADDDNEVDSVAYDDQVTDLVAAVRDMGDFRAGDVEGSQVVREDGSEAVACLAGSQPPFGADLIAGEDHSGT
jgi:hypothetical protein